ncbi:MOSC domain-containing protein [Symbioplanes lichenis]|uniref:MOSC domain-containing protein n=1 Tax=Symbioplanes lichenis TaxID=1629072 RepID=UPI0027386F9D|nr:MOSC domain-containing protein [Actinoplanes lichenis]
MTRGLVAAVSCNGAYTFSKAGRGGIELVPGWGVRGDVHAGVTVRHRSRVAADPEQPNLRQVHLMHRELFDEVGAKGYAVPAGGLGENVTTSGLDLLGLPCGTILRFGPVPATTPDGPGERRPGGPGEPVGHARARVRAAADDREVPGDGSALDVVAAARRTIVNAGLSDVADVLEGVVRAELGCGESDGRAAVVVTGLRNPCAQINRFRRGLLKEVLGRGEDGRLVRRAGIMAVVLRGGIVGPGAEVVAEFPAGAHRPLDWV